MIFSPKNVILLLFTIDQATFHENPLFHFQALKNVYRGFCVLTSETSRSPDFKKPLGWGTTVRELKVLSKMPSVFVNHATGVGDHFPGA